MPAFSELLSRWEDRRLVAAFLKQREEQAFRRLYRRHTPRLYQFALRLAGGIEHEAEELVQDTWVRAVERLPDFRWESQLRTWLAGIAVNRCRELFRQRSKQHNALSVDTLTEDSAPLALENSEYIDLEHALATLPHGYREILLLHDVEGYTHQEISGMLDIEIGTSKSQLHHARRAMRAVLRS